MNVVLHGYEIINECSSCVDLMSLDQKLLDMLSIYAGMVVEVVNIAGATHE